MTSNSDLPPLSRDAFVANVLWMGVNLACQGALGIDLDFRGNHQRGQAFCANGLGDEIVVLWEEHGVVMLVHDNDELPAPPRVPPPSALRELTERAPSSGVKATAWLWICGDSASPRLAPWPQNSLLTLVDAFCGPPLGSVYEDHELETELFEAIRDEPTELSAALVGRLLEDPLDRRIETGMRGTRLEAARVLAENLGRFGLLWSTVERDVAERG